MNIVLSTDDNYVQHCCVTMASILKNNQDVVFYIFTEGLSEENEKLMTALVNKFNGQINFCMIDESIVSKFPMPEGAGDHISVATYYRLFVDLVLPKELDKVIYMDCDIVVRSSLQLLWETNVAGCALGVVYQEQTPSQEQDQRRLGIPIEFGYFNAGVLLINLSFWRDNSVTEKLFDFIKYSYSKIHQHDQDTLNACLYNKVKPIDYIWNYLPLFDPKKPHIFPKGVDYTNESDPVVVHFVSIPKPWEIGSYNPYTYEYYKYLEMTPFAGWKPKFEWKKYFNHVIKKKTIIFISKIDVFNIRKLGFIQRVISK